MPPATYTNEWTWLALYTRMSILIRTSLNTKQVHHLEARIMAQNAAVANTRAALVHQHRQHWAVFPAVYALLWRPTDWRRYYCPSPVREVLLERSVPSLLWELVLLKVLKGFERVSPSAAPVKCKVRNRAFHVCYHLLHAPRREVSYPTRRSSASRLSCSSASGEPGCLVAAVDWQWRSVPCVWEAWRY